MSADLIRFAKPLLAATLLSAFCWAAIDSRKSAADADAVFKAIRKERHTDPDSALKNAKNAYLQAQANVYPQAWIQSFRLLYAGISIQRNILPDAEQLLSFDPQSAEIATRQLAARAYLEQKKGHIDLAAKMGAQALAAAVPLNDPCWKAEVMIHYAYSLVDLNNPLADSELSQAEREARNCDDPYWTVLQQYVKGNLYEKRFRWEQDKSSFEAVWRLAESYKFADLVPLSRGNLALAYYNLGDLDSALSLLKNAETFYGGNKRYDLAIDIGHRGRVLHLLDRDDEAVNDYKKAIDLLKQEGLQGDSYYARFVDELTAVLIDMGHVSEASVYNNEVIAHASPDSERRVLNTSRLNAAAITRMRGQPQAALLQLRAVETAVAQDRNAEVKWRWHSELAQTLASLARKQQAEREFRTAVETADGVRKTIDGDWNRMTFSVYEEKLLALYIDFEVSLGNAPAALQLAETFRAQRLAEKLHFTSAPLPEQFQRIARARQAVILSYWLTAKHSYLWATTAREIKLFPLQNLETLDRDIAKHNIEIANSRDLLTSPELPTALYRKLIAPADSIIPPGSNVIVVPDGPLAALNFETLIPPARPCKFWLNSVTVTVAPSLAVLQVSQVQPRRPQKFLLVGATRPAGGLKPLLDREIDDIPKLFPAVRVLPLTGQNASPQNLLDSKPAEFSLLHISAHAFANKDSPLDSYIALTPDGTHLDGRLYAHDLMQLNLNSGLVTLSVCEGAGGKTLPGEGLIGLTWAILSSGARNVVAGLWKVPDSATADFMHRFYTFLSAREDPAKALHDAKIAMTDKKSVPYYWAAFQLYSR